MQKLKFITPHYPKAAKTYVLLTAKE